MDDEYIRHRMKSNLLDGRRSQSILQNKQKENASFILKIILFQNKLDNILKMVIRHHPQNNKMKRKKNTQLNNYNGCYNNFTYISVG